MNQVWVGKIGDSFDYISGILFNMETTSDMICTCFNGLLQMERFALLKRFRLSSVYIDYSLIRILDVYTRVCLDLRLLAQCF